MARRLQQLCPADRVLGCLRAAWLLLLFVLELD